MGPGLAWLAAFSTAGLALYALGPAAGMTIDWGQLGPWLDGTPPELVLASMGRFVGLLAVAWVLGSTLIYGLARLAGIERPSLRRLSIGPLRRAVEALLAAHLVLSVAAPVTAGTDPRPPAVAPSSPGETVSPSYVPVPAGFPAEETVAEEGTLAEAGPVTVTVAPGDHFWALAERRLAAVWGRCPTDAETAPYWVRVVAENRGRIRSGDPDLIFPGEVVVLPAIDRES